MNSIYFVLLVLFGDNVSCFKPNYTVKRQSKSIFSDKRYTETITPARYKVAVGKKDIKYENVANNFMPEYNFPDVEYPTNIIEASKPFYFKTGESNALLTPFPNDVKTNFNSFLAKPELKNVSSKIRSEYNPPQNENISSGKITKSESKKSSNFTVTEPSMTNENNDLIEIIEIITPVVPPSVKEPVNKNNTNSVEENIVKSEKMISSTLESRERLEDFDYSVNCTEALFFENNTADVLCDDQEEVLDSYELFYDDESLKEDNSTESGIVIGDGNSIEYAITTTSPETSVFPKVSSSDFDIVLVENNKTSIVNNKPLKLSFKPPQIIKKKKVLQSKYKPTFS